MNGVKGCGFDLTGQAYDHITLREVAAEINVSLHGLLCGATPVSLAGNAIISEPSK